MLVVVPVSAIVHVVRVELLVLLGVLDALEEATLLLVEPSGTPARDGS